MITAHLAATFAGLSVYVHTIEHADGVVLVDTPDGLVVIGGDVAYSSPELGRRHEPEHDGFGYGSATAGEAVE